MQIKVRGFLIVLSKYIMFSTLKLLQITGLNLNRHVLAGGHAGGLSITDAVCT